MAQRSGPRYLAYQAEYHQRPDVKERKRRQNAERSKTPQEKARKLAWAHTAHGRRMTAESKRIYYQNNKARIQEKRRQQYHSNPLHKLGKLLRGRLWLALRGRSIAGSLVRDLGCSVAEFKAYIEKQFQPGMSWSNWGKWHLDHIRPLASFDLFDRQQLLVACHYTNYQPLWAPDNLRKGSSCGRK